MRSLLALFCIVLSATPLLGNGVIVVDAATGTCLPLRSSEVSVVIENQVAMTTATMVFVNTTADTLLPTFAFPMPDGASATGIAYVLSGQIHHAVISPTPQDTSLPGGTPNAALQTFLGKNPLYFHVDRALKADSALTVELTYVEFLRYSDGSVYYRYPGCYTAISGDPLARQSLTVSLFSSRTIDNLELTSHTGALITNTGTEGTVSYEAMEQPATSDFTLSYSLSLNELGLFGLSTLLDDTASVADSIDGGYFTFVVEPNPSGTADVMKKTFTFVIDRSGSMGGEKMIQARQAATYIVNNLNEGDYFNLIDFDDVITSFRPTHVPYTTENKNDALAYIATLEARNLTNIAGALTTAIGQFHKATDSTANIIIFLTDGQPTAGTTDPDGILTAIASSQAGNQSDVGIFVFGIGSDVNVSLLTQIAAANDGLVEFLRSDEVESRITGFYRKVRNPVLINSNVTFSDAQIREVYPDPLPDLYKGQQLIMTGRYDTPDTTTIVFRGTAFGSPVEYRYSLALSDSSAARYQFLPKLWAKSKIENLVIQYYAATGTAEADSIKDEIVSLSLRYGIVTEFTSYTPDGYGRGSGATEVAGDPRRAGPGGIELAGNYPNPFNPSTKITFRIRGAISGIAVIRIYNVLGQLVRALSAPVRGAGLYTVDWDGRSDRGDEVPSGVYVYVLSLEQGVFAGKMTLVR